MSPLESYLSEINATPLLTRDEEGELARRIRAGQLRRPGKRGRDGGPLKAEDYTADGLAARNHLVSANLRLVVSVARHYRGRGLQLDDLIAEGNRGLFHAADQFDGAKGCKFSTYASFWVRQSILAAIRNQVPTIHIPGYVVADLAKARKAASAKLPPARDEPTAAEVLAAFRGKARSRACLLQALIVMEGGGSNCRPDIGDGMALDLLAADHSASSPCKTSLGEEVAQVLDALTTIDAREAAVLRMRFGLGGPSLTLQEVGARLGGLSRERVRQLEQAAILHLRKKLAA